MSDESLQIEFGDMIPLVKAAPKFGVSPRTLRVWCDAGEVDHKKRPGKTPQGNRYYIPQTAIRADRILHVRRAA